MKNFGTFQKAIALAVGLSLSASLAMAHEGKMMTMPANGATVAANTKVMHLMFDAPMKITTVTMTDPRGKTMKVKGPAANQAVKVWEGQLPRLAAGAYKIDWRGMSPDGHAMNGTFGFYVGR